MVQDPSLLLRAEEAAKLLSLGRSTVFAMLAAGELPVVRIGRAVRIPRRELEVWVRDRTHSTDHLSPMHAAGERSDLSQGRAKGLTLEQK